MPYRKIDGERNEMEEKDQQSAKPDDPCNVSDGYFDRLDQRLQFDTSISGSEDLSESDLKDIASLQLSGRIISVMFTIPYTVRALGDQSREWVRI